jgi:hypothetical protein
VDPDMQDILNEAVAKAKLKGKDNKQLKSLVTQIIDKINEPESEHNS